MTTNEFWGYLLELVFASLLGLAVFLIMLKPLRMLMGFNSRLAAAKTFYVRSLFVLLMLTALIPVAGSYSNLPSDASMMEYVWHAAGELNNVMIGQAIVLGAYVVIMAVLSLGLARFRDE